MGGLTRMPPCRTNTSTPRSNALDGKRREGKGREGRGEGEKGRREDSREGG